MKRLSWCHKEKDSCLPLNVSLLKPANTMYINSKILQAMRKIYYKFKMLWKKNSIYISLKVKIK